MKILVLAFRFPHPPTDGARIRLHYVTEALASRHEVDVVALNEGRVPREHVRAAEARVRRLHVFDKPRAAFRMRALRGLAHRRSLQEAYFRFPDVQAWVDAHASEYDALFCFHTRMAPYLAKAQGARVIDLIDATSLNYREAVASAREPWRTLYAVEHRRALRSEIDAARAFERSLITSPYDKAYLEEHHGAPLERLKVVPNGVRPDLLDRAPAIGAPTHPSPMLVFVGKMDTIPNADAAVHFARDVLPLVRASADARFMVVGANPPRRVRALARLPGVVVTGRVADPADFMERAHVVVSPLRFAGGIQNKVLEALALGKPVVATTRATRALAGVPGEHYAVADEPHAMASTILRLLDEPGERESLGKRGRDLVRRHYAWPRVREDILAVVDAAIAEARRGPD